MKSSSPIIINSNSYSISPFKCISRWWNSSSGKSTLIDILSGMLSVKQGEITINEKNVSADIIESWQAKIAYISQKNYLN